MLVEIWATITTGWTVLVTLTNIIHVSQFVYSTLALATFDASPLFAKLSARYCIKLMAFKSFQERLRTSKTGRVCPLVGPSCKHLTIHILVHLALFRLNSISLQFEMTSYPFISIYWSENLKPFFYYQSLNKCYIYIIIFINYQDKAKQSMQRRASKQMQVSELLNDL